MQKPLGRMFIQRSHPIPLLFSTPIKQSNLIIIIFWTANVCLKSIKYIFNEEHLCGIEGVKLHYLDRTSRSYLDIYLHVRYQHLQFGVSQILIKSIVKLECYFVDFPQIINQKKSQLFEHKVWQKFGNIWWQNLEYSLCRDNNNIAQTVLGIWRVEMHQTYLLIFSQGMPHNNSLWQRWINHSCQFMKYYFVHFLPDFHVTRIYFQIKMV